MLKKKVLAHRGVLFQLALLLVLFCVAGVSKAATLQIQSIEVTQAIQCLDASSGYTNCTDNSLDVVFGKPTVVRVYISHDDSTPCPENETFVPIKGCKSVPVTIRWWVLKTGQSPDGIFPYEDTEYFDVPCSTSITELRKTKKGSANFVIPAEKFGIPSISQGNVYIVEAEVSGNVQQLTGSVSPPQNTLYVLGALIDYKPDTSSYTPPYSGPSVGDKYAGLYASRLMKKMYPMPVRYIWTDQLIEYTGPDIRLNGAASQGREVIKAVEDWKTYLKMTPVPDVVVGWLPKGVTGYLGDSLKGGEAGLNATFCIDFDEDINQVCVAHEAGHALGLQHPTTFGDITDSCAPENASSGFGTGIGETGFDYLKTYWPCVGSTNSSATQFCPDGEATMVPYDITGNSGAWDGVSGFMGASGGDWISPYLWNRLLNKPFSLDWSNCESTSGSATSFMSIMPVATAADPPTDVIVVSGQVTVTSGELSGTLDPIFHIESDGPFAVSDPFGEYCIDLVSDGTTLSTNCFNLSFEAPETGDHLSTDFFVFKIPHQTGTDQIVLRAGLITLDEKIQSNNAPVVNITSPLSGGTMSGTIDIEWTGSDPDSDPLIYTVLYSWDNGLSFVPLAVNVTKTNLKVDTASLIGGQTAFIRVIASDGFNTTSVDSVIFEVEAKPPDVVITAPIDNALITKTEKLFLSGNAQDLQDGEITEKNSFSWWLDGTPLGMGSEIILPPDSLSLGKHTISLNATNSYDQTSITSINVLVEQPPVAECADATVSAGDSCNADASINNGSYDPEDPEGNPYRITQSPEGPYELGDTSVALTITNNRGVSDQCLGIVTVQDTTPPVISCNAPATITPPDAPISFTATATDNCDYESSVEIVESDCYYYTKKGKIIDKKESCIIEIADDQITLLDTGGIDDHISWTVEATDDYGNTSIATCRVLVVNPAP